MADFWCRFGCADIYRCAHCNCTVCVESDGVKRPTRPMSDDEVPDAREAYERILPRLKAIADSFERRGYSTRVLTLEELEAVENSLKDGDNRRHPLDHGTADASELPGPATEGSNG